MFFTKISFAGTNYYVSTSGNNSNNGLSVSTPFKTVTYAANTAAHGDTINVIAGTYINTSYGTWNIWKTGQTVKINNKNSSTGNYLVIRPYNNGIVKFRGDGDYIFQIRNSSYIQIENFEIEGEVNNVPLDSALKYQFVYHDNILNKDTFRVAFGTANSAIAAMTFSTLSNITNPTTINNIGLLVQGSHHINIIQNHIHHNTGTGLRVFQSDYINVLGNEIDNNSRRSSVGNHGMVFHSSTSIDNNNGYKVLIARNNVHDNYNEVYSWSPLKTFITPHIDEGKGISMQKNTVANGWLHGKIKIENNIAHHNGFSGIHINEGIRMDIINNTVFNNSFSYNGNGNNFGISTQQADSIGIYNNIVEAATDGFAISAGSSVNITVSNNLVNGVIDNDIAAIDVNTLFASPSFIDTFQFELQSTSLAINSSLISIAPSDDYFSNIRDGSPDIGAIEYFYSVLPLTLFNFSLQHIEDKSVLLSWSTLSEKELSSFIVEKSDDTVQWITLSSVKAKGNSSSLINYTTTDYSPFVGFNYYRLKQFETNGTFSYSNIVGIKFNYSQKQIIISPNPTSLNFNITLPIENSIIEIFNTLGQIVLKQKFDTQKSILITQNFPSGLYLVKVSNNNGELIGLQKVVKESQ